MRRLDELHLEHPVYGSRKLTVLLRPAGLAINRKGVQRLLRGMGIEASHATPKGSMPGPGHQIYPYLLADLEVTGADQVWCLAITYVPMARGFMYLVAVLDWWSRYVLAWRLSNTMEAAFCVDAWEAALRAGRRAPLISNTGQGGPVHSAHVPGCGAIGGRGSEHGWAGPLAGQPVYRAALAQRQGGRHLSARVRQRVGCGAWTGALVDGYNQERPHQSLG